LTKAWLLILGLLAQLATCADRHLDRAQWKLDPVPVAHVDRPIRAGMLESGQYILARRISEQLQPEELVRVDRGGQHPIAIPARDTTCFGDGLAVEENTWRYSGCSGNGVQFVASNGGTTYVTNDSELFAREWMPFDEAEGGVLLSIAKDGRTAVLKIVMPGKAPEPLGTFDRGIDLWGTEAGEAVRLGEEKIAVVTIEPAGSADFSLMLRVVDHGETTTSTLATNSGGWASIDAVAGAAGELVVVAVPYERTGVVAFVIGEGAPVMHHLSRTTGMGGPYPGVHAIATSGRFAAAWIEDRTVRLAEFDARHALPAVTVSDDVNGDASLLSLANGTIFWSAADGSVMMRTLPEPITGSLLASDLLGRLSRRIDRLIGVEPRR
jgi:hypothetical protein